jgi:hypothetical protein
MDHLHPLMVTALASVIPPRDDWAIVHQIFRRGACDGCPRYEVKRDKHPYGEGHAVELHEECTLGEFASDLPSDCPAFKATIKDME